MFRVVAFLVEQFVQAAAGPEPVLERRRLTIDLSETDDLFEYDGPYPNAGGEQADHDELDNEIGLDEQPPKREVGPRRDQIGRINR